MATNVAIRPGSWLGRRTASHSFRVGVVLCLSMSVIGATTARAAGRATRHAAPPFGELWIGTMHTADVLSAVDDGATRQFLRSTGSILLGAPEDAPAAMAWASAAAFGDDLAAGRIPSTVRVVMYDPEGWVATPLTERRDPAAAMRTFGELARANGFVAVIAPHPSLVAVRGADCAIGTGESTEDAYLRCGIQAAAARWADVVEVQAQYLETDVAAYRAFVAAAALQARHANPSVTVVSGISTTFTDDPQVLYAAWRSVLDLVDGHYLNVPDGLRPDVATAFLRSVAATAS